MLERGLWQKNYRPVSLLFVVWKIFEKLVNNRLVHHLKKFFLLSSMVRTSRSTLDLLTAARAFDRFWLLQLLYLIYQRLVTRFGMLVFFTNSCL